MMDANGLNKVIEQIRKDYLLIAKGRLWSILGGFIGVVTAVGLISYGSAITALESSTAQKATEHIKQLKGDAESYVKEIADIRRTLGEPPGTILPFGGVAVLDDPVGYIPCDGRQVKRDDYPDLFAAIGTAWGQGDGSTTFNVPDLRGYFLRGTDAGARRDPDVADRTAIGEERGMGGNIGDNVGSVQSDEFGKHTHDGEGNHQHYWKGYNNVKWGRKCDRELSIGTPRILRMQLLDLMAPTTTALRAATRHVRRTLTSTLLLSISVATLGKRRACGPVCPP
jgi:hypothetical protein